MPKQEAGAKGLEPWCEAAVSGKASGGDCTVHPAREPDPDLAGEKPIERQGRGSN